MLRLRNYQLQLSRKETIFFFYSGTVIASALKILNEKSHTTNLGIIVSYSELIVGGDKVGMRNVVLGQENLFC